MMRRSVFIRTRLPMVPVPDLNGLCLHLGQANSGLSSLNHANGAPYWAYLWAGGRGLARYLLDHPETVAGKAVVDLGAGSGVAGIAAMIAGGACLTSVDTDPNARIACVLNSRANGISTKTRRTLPQEGDILLAGDVFYNPKLARRMLPVLQAARDRGTMVLIGDPMRRDLPRAQLDLIAELPAIDFGQRHAVPTGIFRLKP